MRPAGDDIPDDCPVRVKDLRERLGLTQTQMAERIGVSFATVNRWENGQSRPRRLAWRRIVDLEAGAWAAIRQVEPVAASTTPTLDFAAKPEAVAAVAEATRLSYGYLSNPAFAAEISSIDPLPHQRIAVYDHMLRQWPLRFLLADDAGAGKTIMTGLYLREMLARRLVTRVLVVPPAGLVGNWEREMRTLFRLPFRIVHGADARIGTRSSGRRAIVSSSASIPSPASAWSHGCARRWPRAPRAPMTSWCSTKPTSWPPTRAGLLRPQDRSLLPRRGAGRPARAG